MPEGISAFPSAPEKFRSNLTSVGRITVDQADYDYAVLEAKSGPYEYFSGFDPSSGWLYISADVPEAYRWPKLRHEVYRHHQYAQHEYACLEALKRELAELTGPDQRAYKVFRLESLRQQSRYAHRRSVVDKYSPMYRNDVSLAYTYLAARLEIEPS